MTYKASVYVTPKAGVVDPQGAVVERALPALGHSGVRNIRVGRYITLEVQGDDLAKVKAAVDDMCRRLLANPIIEDYRFEVFPVESADGGERDVTAGPVRFGIVVFPGSNCDYDACHVLSTFREADSYYLWHKDRDLQRADCVILPGGFSYGDYLRTGAVARFSPIMQEVAAFAAAGGLVLGICNGFQTLAEAHLLHGALRRNRGLRFICHPQCLRVERIDTPFTSRLEVGQVIQIPVNHNEGNWTAGADSLQEIENQKLVAFRYCDAQGTVNDAANPNGATDNVAGILNEFGNVLGMMPHPERVCEEITGGVDGRGIFQSMIDHVLAGGGG